MKEFNDTGLCVPRNNYMIDMSKKLEKIKNLVDKGKYFTINRPRQYGKTTIMSQIRRNIGGDEYLVISTSFEGVGDSIFENEKKLSNGFIQILSQRTKMSEDKLIYEYIRNNYDNVNDLRELSVFITEMIKEINCKVILLIDEVDKACNNQLFLSFLGMLRDKYLLRNDDMDYTFHSVILAGVHDVKNLKLKLRPDEEKKYNSPWNIATDFNVDMSFSEEEIKTMLDGYTNEKKVKMNKEEISKQLRFYTSGYPYLVSKLCKIIDEEIMPKKYGEDISKWEWTEENIIESVKILLLLTNANFDTIIKNLENNKDLYNFVENIILGEKNYNYIVSVPIINKASIHGIIKENRNGKIMIHNKIYEEYITNYIIGKIETGSKFIIDAIQSTYIKENGKLDINKVLIKFQEVIKEKYSKKDLIYDDDMLEHNLRLLFLVFLKPIINGIGFSFKEVETSEEKRVDIIIIFREEKFVIELKVWRGIKLHEEGKIQLLDYMRRENVDKGYMVIMDKNKGKEFKQATEDGLFMVWV